jgi:hypothetical protein
MSLHLALFKQRIEVTKACNVTSEAITGGIVTKATSITRDCPQHDATSPESVKFKEDNSAASYFLWIVIFPFLR